MTDAGKSSADFIERFERAAAGLPLAGWHIHVALSGGVDSMLLLDLLHESGTAASLSAIHVDHGLHERSAAWAERCADVAAGLGVELVVRRLELDPAPGQSLEAVARESRYDCLATFVGADEVLATAHHADDQLETVLLRMLRGSGVRGLAAIHAASAFGRGWLVRPLLEFTRAEIETEARHRGLSWIEDPSNEDLRFDRNYLRARVIPAIRERWPASPAIATRLATQMAEAERVLADMAALDLGDIVDSRIPLERFAGMSAARITNALRHAVGAAGLPLPSRAQLGELRRALGARADAEVLVTWPGAEARIHRRVLYLLPAAVPLAPAHGRLDADATFRFSDGELRLEVTDVYGIPDRWVRRGLAVAFRQGGERFRPEGRRHHKSLKAWFQEAGVVPWMRGRVPLLFHDDQLIAVADMCLAGDLPQTAADAPFWRPVWRGHAPLS